MTAPIIKRTQVNVDFMMIQILSLSIFAALAKSVNAFHHFKLTILETTARGMVKIKTHAGGSQLLISSLARTVVNVELVAMKIQEKLTLKVTSALGTGETKTFADTMIPNTSMLIGTAALVDLEDALTAEREMQEATDAIGTLKT